MCITRFITWLYIHYMLNYILPWSITCSITSCLDPLLALLHPVFIHYMIHYMMHYMPLQFPSIHYMLHYMVHYMVHYLFNYILHYMTLHDPLNLLVIPASPRRRDRRARSQQSFFCWIYVSGQYSSARRSVWGPCRTRRWWWPARGPWTAEVQLCRWWLGRHGWEVNCRWLECRGCDCEIFQWSCQVQRFNQLDQTQSWLGRRSTKDWKSPGIPTEFEIENQLASQPSLKI